ncbi:MAG: aconitase X [Clostridiaceae bacterium]|nr:aconitase X [Clostridiaceae bacterium]
MISYHMNLTEDEEAMLRGDKGDTLRKIMETLVLYGETFGAERMAPVTGASHLVTSFGIPLLKPLFRIMDQLVAGGLTAPRPFTADPRPLDYQNVPCSMMEKIVFRIMYGKQREYEQQLLKIGMKENGFSCACYLPEMGNCPQKGDILSWAESSAVVYANSVIGARCNRNSGVLELFGTLAGRVPVFDLLTDEGRKAKWVIEVRTSGLPEAQILGSAIGLKVMEAVPYIKGLDTWLGRSLTDEVKAYLKDMGAATASNGAVGLYHVANLTPEATEHGEALILPDAATYVIDDAELKRVRESYPVMWPDPAARPRLCFIGCPHLSYGQLLDWSEKILAALTKQNRQTVAVPTIMTAPPGVLAKFSRSELSNKLQAAGVRLTSICPLMYMNNPIAAKKPVVTNSNKLRTYTTARYDTDEQIIKIISGEAIQ